MTPEQETFISKFRDNAQRLAEREKPARELGLSLLADFIREASWVLLQGIAKQERRFQEGLPHQTERVVIDKTSGADLLIDAIERRYGHNVPKIPGNKTQASKEAEATRLNFQTESTEETSGEGSD